MTLTTLFENARTCLRDGLGIPTWLALASAGLLVHLLVNTCLRKPPTALPGVIGSLLAALALEAWEIWYRYRDIGLFAPGNDPLWLIGARHSTDVCIVLSLPVTVWLVGIARQ